MQDTSSNYSKKIAQFWRNAFKNANSSKFYSKNCKLPLARIKRLMKVEEDVKMVASEVPALFSFVTEVFVQELTVRAWMCTEDGKRKILQTSDIGFAAKTSSMYDFLTYVIPPTTLCDKEDFSINNYARSNNYIDSYPFNDSMFQDQRYQTEKPYFPDNTRREKE